MFFKHLRYILLFVAGYFLPVLSIDPQKVVTQIREFLSVAEYIVQSKRNLDVLRLELKKIPLFVKGCAQLRRTDERYPNLIVGNNLVVLKDDKGDFIQKLDEQGKPLYDESGKPVYKKLTVACNSFKDVLTGVNRTLDFVKNTLLGSGKQPNALFIKLLNVLGLQSKIPSVSELSETITALQYFIDRVDQVMKIGTKKPETEESKTAEEKAAQDVASAPTEGQPTEAAGADQAAVTTPTTETTGETQAAGAPAATEATGAQTPAEGQASTENAQVMGAQAEAPTTSESGAATATQATGEASSATAAQVPAETAAITDAQAPTQTVAPSDTQAPATTEPTAQAADQASASPNAAPITDSLGNAREDSASVKA